MSEVETSLSTRAYEPEHPGRTGIIRGAVAGFAGGVVLAAALVGFDVVGSGAADALVFVATPTLSGLMGAAVGGTVEVGLPSLDKGPSRFSGLFRRGK